MTSSNLTPERAILSIVMFAAFADGAKDEREREHIRQFAQQLGQELPEMAAAYQDVLMSRVRLVDVAASLQEQRQRLYAYELAVCVCESDGAICEAERAFLEQLQDALGLKHNAVKSAPVQTADAIVLAAGSVAPVSQPDVQQRSELHSEQRSDLRAAAARETPLATGKARSTLDDARVDAMVLNYSILNGALELLPQSWASMAIIPLQIKMVYRIGKQAGYDLDQGHIRELLATVGVGLTSQYVEQFGRKLVAGLLGSLLGGTGRKLGRAATSMAMSFATTYALGQLAMRYYGEGRQMNTELLKRTFGEMLEPARSLQSRYLPQMQRKAASLDAQQVLSMLKSGDI